MPVAIRNAFGSLGFAGYLNKYEALTIRKRFHAWSIYIRTELKDYA